MSPNLRSKKQQVVPFYCDECRVQVDPGWVCPNCKRVLCRKHFAGNTLPVERPGLCVRCKQERILTDEETQQA